MLIRVENGYYDSDYLDDLEAVGVMYFDNIDKAKAYVETALAGEDWSANHPGMIFDTYVYDKCYVYGTTGALRAFKYYKIEMM